MQRKTSWHTLWVERKSVKKCKRCGGDIIWLTNRKGQPYAADVAWHKDGEGNERPVQAGLYHVCPGTLDERIVECERYLGELRAQLSASDCDWFDNRAAIAAMIETNERDLATMQQQRAARATKGQTA